MNTGSQKIIDNSFYTIFLSFYVLAWVCLFDVKSKVSNVKRRIRRIDGRNYTGNRKLRFHQGNSGKKYLFIIQANPKNFITNREMYKVELKNKLITGSS